jgi:hypothetical protein
MSNQSGVRIYYLRDPKTVTTESRGAPVGCLASHYDPKSRLLRFGLATGAPSQSFEKKLFRAMAEVRLKHKSLSLTFDAEPNGHEISKRIMTALAGAADECLKQRQAEKNRSNSNKHKKSAVNSFSSFLKDKVSQGKNLVDVLDDIETKSNSDWRKSISLRAGEAAKGWLAMAAVPKAPDTQPSFAPTFKESPVSSITSVIQGKVESFVASARK